MKLSEGLTEFKSFKSRGFDFKTVLAVLVSMVVSPEKTVHSYLNSATGEGSMMGKNVFYRMKNSPSVCWRMLLWHLVMRFLKVTSEDCDTPGLLFRYLIFDDSTLPKTGKRMEKIGRVWDHVTNGYVLGFKLLVMMYWDGKSSLPLDFSLHREKGKKEERPYGMTKKELKRQYSRKCLNRFKLDAFNVGFINPKIHFCKELLTVFQVTSDNIGLKVMLFPLPSF